MGEIFKKIVERRKAAQQPTTGTAGPKAPHTADWLYAKHKADQGFGTAPADPAAPATGVSVPAGGQVLTDEEAERRRLGGL